MKKYIKLAFYSGLSIGVIILAFQGYKYTQKTPSLQHPLSPFNEAKALAFPPESAPLDNLASRYALNSWYVISLGNVPVGVVAVGVDGTQLGASSDYFAQFASRIGYSAFASTLQGMFKEDDSHRRSLTQHLTSKNEGVTLQDKQNTWVQENNKLKLEVNHGATLQGLFPIQLPSSSFTDEFSANSTLFYYRPKSMDKVKYVLFPFVGVSLLSEKAELKYDDDNFLICLLLKISSWTLKKLTKKNIKII